MNYLLFMSGFVNYIARECHNAADGYQTNWNFSGASQGVMLLYMIVFKLSSRRDFPNCNSGNEFKATRDAPMAITR
jgi:hypothetical protein